MTRTGLGMVVRGATAATRHGHFVALELFSIVKKGVVFVKMQVTGSIEEIMESLDGKRVFAEIKEKLIGVFQAALTHEGIEEAINERVKTAVERRAKEQLQLAVDEAIKIKPTTAAALSGYHVTGWASLQIKQEIGQLSTLRHNVRLLVAEQVTNTLKEHMPVIQRAILHEAVSNRIDQVITDRLKDVPIEDVIERTVRKVLAGK